MHSISEVIILYNDQHQHKKQQQQTTGLIQRLINNTNLLSIGVIVAEKLTEKGDIVKDWQIWQG